LQKDDPVIEIPEDLSCPEIKVTKAEIIEKLTCHEDVVDDEMVDKDMSLKNKILKDRKNTMKEKRSKKGKRRMRNS
jgi:hypothetical protein